MGGGGTSAGLTGPAPDEPVIDAGDVAGATVATPLWIQSLTPVIHPDYHPAPPPDGSIFYTHVTLEHERGPPPGVRGAGLEVPDAGFQTQLLRSLPR